MSKRNRHILTYLLLGLTAGGFVLPLVWMVAVSFKPIGELTSPALLPARPEADAYLNVLGIESAKNKPAAAGTRGTERRVNLLLYARNTLIIMVLSLVGVVLSCSIAAYGFARINFPGRDLMFGVCLATMMIPFPVIMVPTYMLFKQLDWIGTFKPLWVPAWFGGAFNIFLLRQFFMGVPRELEESAMIDGCSRWGCFWRIMLPLSTPALVVVSLFHCLAVWNDLVGPMIFLTHEEHFTLALGLQMLFSRTGDTPWNELMAASTLIVLPVLVLFVLAQQTFLKGIATSGIKG
ncbi:MAG: carbohydrate ABC transporter permease [Phycisphaerae bacterium]